jgi:hypothetical protein
MKVLNFLFIIALSFPAIGQQANVYELADPTTMKSRILVDFESYFFHAGEQFYSVRPGFIYGLQNERHSLGIAVPFVHTIFVQDYAGFENTTGLGDLQMRYTGVPYLNKNGLGLTKVTSYFEASAPTGESQLGRGAGTWLYKPGVIFSIKPSPEISFYPEIKFQFSGQPANSLGGGDGLPDPEDPDKDGKMQNLFVTLPVVIIMDTWDGWFSLNAQYIHSFTEGTNFFFMRMDLGKMVGQRTSASLTVSKFIAGQPRLNVIVQVRFQFLLQE